MNLDNSVSLPPSPSTSFSFREEGDMTSSFSLLDDENEKLNITQIDASEDARIDWEDEDEEELKEDLSRVFGNDNSTKIRGEAIDRSERDNKNNNLNNNKIIYDELNRKLEVFAEKLFKCDSKIEDLKRFGESFLMDFKVGKKNIPYFIYTPEVDSLFVLMKDVTVELEVALKGKFSETIDLFWDHIIAKSKKLALDGLWSVTLQHSANPKHVKLRFKWEDQGQTYAIMVHSVKKLKESIFFYETKLISTYCKIDRRFKIISGFLLFWGTQRRLFLKKIFGYHDLIFMLIFYFLSLGLMPSVQTSFKIPEENKRKQVIYKKSHMTFQNEWKYIQKEVELGFEDDVAKIKNHIEEEKKHNVKFAGKCKISAGEILYRFFYYFGVEFPSLFESIKEPEGPPKFILLDVRTGRHIYLDYHDDFQRFLFSIDLSISSFGTRSLSTLFIKNPMTLTLSTSHIFSSESKESIVEKIKEYIHENPFENVEKFLNNFFFHRVEIEFGVAYGRVKRGEGKSLCEDFDYRNLTKIL